MEGQKLSWQFWVDRGGTFTDVVARNPQGELIVRKLLSESPEHYQDATLEAIRELLGIERGSPIPVEKIDSVKMGTTIATNALLEHKGARTALLITKGFKDAIRIGYQNRPDIFALNVILPKMLYAEVVEVIERVSAHGEVLTALDVGGARDELKRLYAAGYRSLAILLMHGYRYTDHEKHLKEIAEEIGFQQISASHEVVPLIKLVSRGDTTLVDAYLSPVLKNYVSQLGAQLPITRLYFMQSNGGLSHADYFHGKDSILSGPAGGIIGAVRTARQEGYENILTFDMGGTSTDVAHYAGELERTTEDEIAGCRIRAPMLAIHTVASGGGSILRFDGARFRVGPQSAGANPGPSCYGLGGPLTITDCNVLLGRLQPEFMPKVFGPSGAAEIDTDVVRKQFAMLRSEVLASAQVQWTCASEITVETIAEGFLSIAINTMANAIKRVSTQKGNDPADYALYCFGGAGGQHACQMAEALGIKTILIHPLAGVLSALGMGLANISIMKELSVEEPLSDGLLDALSSRLASTTATTVEEVAQQNLEQYPVDTICKAHVRYEGTDFALPVQLGSASDIKTTFEEAHFKRYGYVLTGKQITVEKLSVESITQPPFPQAAKVVTQKREDFPTLSTVPTKKASVYLNGKWCDTPVYQRSQLAVGTTVSGPAVVIDPTSTLVIQANWDATILQSGMLQMKRVHGGTTMQLAPAPLQPDPILLEVFNNLFMFIAEQMGITLQNTSHSVNIKERLDFSCALFDGIGNLIANAPHIPVHLGSMGESVQEMIRQVGDQLRPGDVYALNDPYHGGTHLPDITVITPYFDDQNQRILFYLASRGHHADIGGITPGSMPPASKSVLEEGVLLDMVRVVEGGRFRADEVRTLLGSGRYPARNPDQNILDLSAQIAANQRGIRELNNVIARYGLETVRSYMQFVQDNAEESIRGLISELREGTHVAEMDSGARVCVAISIDSTARSATIDFTDTSIQQPDNFNAPQSICKAAVLYVFRTLVPENIPLNAGCLKPLSIIIPEGSFLLPSYPAAVVAGNVETSQVIVDALYAALGKLANSQGTMNNFTFGNEHYQYYETICGGSGAGATFDGADAIQTHMTNSRLTDPEVLELRYPVLVEEFKIREGSGGAGTHTGGNGAFRKIKFLAHMTASILSNRRITCARGLAGGADGSPGKNYVERKDGSIEKLTFRDSVEMTKGDSFVIETPGGGGFGSSSGTPPESERR